MSLAADLTCSSQLRTPLTSIQLATDELKYCETKQQQEVLLQVVSAASDSLLSLINDMLDLGKIVAGKMVLKMSWFDLREMLDEVVLVLMPFASRKNVSVKLEVGTPLHCFVRLDRTRLRQVLLNLGTNAIKYSNRDVVMRVTLEKGDSELCVRVIDSGPGIKPEEMDKLFAVFSRLSEDGNESGASGSGLGLCIAKELVDLMGGEIGVMSELQVGSEFYFCIPAESCNGFPSPTSNSSAMSMSSEDTSSQAVQVSDMSTPQVSLVEHKEMEKDRGLAEDDFLSFVCAPALSVLVVDDTVVNLKLMERILMRLGANVVTATSGEKALEIAAQHAKFDLVLLDFFMPGMDGVETCARLRQLPEYAAVPIICVTASEKPAGYEGFTDYLPKPFPAPLLQSMIEKHVAD